MLIIHVLISSGLVARPLSKNDMNFIIILVIIITYLEEEAEGDEKENYI